MTTLSRRARAAGLAALAVVGISGGGISGGLSAEEPAAGPVDVFAAAEADQVELKAFARDSRRANLLIANRTDRPLTVAVPGAVAVVPALAQRFGDDFNWLNLGQDRRKSPQRVGAGPWGVPGQQRQQGPMFDFFQPLDVRALFSIPPEREVRVDLVGVCLDHGLPEPNPRMPVELVPIDQASSAPEVAALIRMLAAGRVPQRVAQLAAWHMQNGISFDSLAAERVPATIGTRPRYSRREIRAAEQIVKRLREANAAGEKVTTVTR